MANTHKIGNRYRVDGIGVYILVGFSIDNFDRIMLVNVNSGSVWSSPVAVTDYEYIDDAEFTELVTDEWSVDKTFSYEIIKANNHA